MGRRLKRAGLVGGGLIVLALSVSLAYRAYRQHEVTEERRIRSSDGIDSLERVRLGGMNQ
jgi:hypothetical protein